MVERVEGVSAYLGSGLFGLLLGLVFVLVLPHSESTNETIVINDQCDGPEGVVDVGIHTSLGLLDSRRVRGTGDKDGRLGKKRRCGWSADDGCVWAEDAGRGRLWRAIPGAGETAPDGQTGDPIGKVGTSTGESDGWRPG